MIQVKFNIPPHEMAALRKKLASLERNISRKFIRQATRQSMKAHMLPQMRRNTPAGGKRNRGKAAFRNAGLKYVGERFHDAGSTGRSTGKLRRSLKVRAIRRSRKGVGTKIQSKFPNSGEAFYGAFLELGWKHYQTGRKIKGQWRWNKVAVRIGNIAKNSLIRGLWARIDAYARSGGPNP